MENGEVPQPEGEGLMDKKAKYTPTIQAAGETPAKRECSPRLID